jgi:hypothetical protein
MKSLVIGDLSLVQELDREGMGAVRGGIMPGGCVVNPIPLPALPTLPQMPVGFPFEQRPLGPTIISNPLL